MEKGGREGRKQGGREERREGGREGRKEGRKEGRGREEREKGGRERRKETQTAGQADASCKSHGVDRISGCVGNEDHWRSTSRDRNRGVAARFSWVLLVVLFLLRPVITKLVSWIIINKEIWAWYGDSAANAKVPPTPDIKGLREFHRSKMRENAESAGAKARKKRSTGFDLIGLRWGEAPHPLFSTRFFMFFSVLPLSLSLCPVPHLATKVPKYLEKCASKPRRGSCSKFSLLSGCHSSCSSAPNGRNLSIQN